MTGQDDRAEELAGLLAEHPTAVVAAIDKDGLFVTMPESVPLVEHRVSSARSALDLVHPADRQKVISAWIETRESGRAETWVTLAAAESGAAATMYTFDVVDRHGVYVGLIVGSDRSAVALDDIAEISSPPPRVGRTRKDSVATVIFCDAAVTGMLGWSEAEILGESSLSFIHPDDQQRAIDLWMDCLSQPGGTCRTRLRHRHRDGRWIWLELSNTNLLDDPDAGYVDCEMLDISEEMEAHEAVRTSEQLLRRVAEALPVGVAQFDLDLRIVYANRRLYEIVGAAPETDEQSLLSCVLDPTVVLSAALSVLGGDDIDFRVEIERMDSGGRRQCTVAMRTLVHEDGSPMGGVVVLEDVTEQARMQAELEHRATYDTLTGCVNRQTVLTRMAEVLSPHLPARPARGAAAIFLDLDEFKDVNDGYGHAAGDALLVAIAQRLRRSVRTVDLVGRLGGDEFLVVCPDVDDAGAARQLADRVARVVAEPVDLGSVVVTQRASIGVAWAGPDDAVDADVLVARADDAMYRAKEEGTSVVLFVASAAEGRAPAGQPDSPSATRGSRVQSGLSDSIRWSQ